jgi:hypothetical protein
MTDVVEAEEMEEKEDQVAMQKQKSQDTWKSKKDKGMKAAREECLSNSREPNRTTGWDKNDR